MKSKERVICGLLVSMWIIAAMAMTRSGSSAAPGLPPGQDEGGAKVSISNFKFEPKVVHVKAGSTVTWENKEGTHTVTADNGGFESPTLSSGQSFSQKFTKPGTYRYYCSFHGSKGGGDMSGTVIVGR